MAIDIEWVAKYPTNDDDWVKTVLIGGVLTLFAWLIVPAFLVAGYLVDALRAGMRESSEPPGFGDWGRMLREGFVATVIGLIYQLIPLIVMVVTVGGSIAAMATGSNTGAAAGFAGLLGGFALASLLALVFGYVALIGVANYAHVGRFGAGFDLSVIRSVGFDSDYAIPWLYGVAVLIAANVVVGVLNFVPIIGAIVGVFVVFYAQIAAAWLWGKGFADATGVDVESASDSGAGAVA